MGIEREAAGRYSFLLAMPTLVGATVLKIDEVPGARIGENAAAYAAGVAAAAVVGYLTLSFLVQVLRRDRLHLFAYYCWALGAVALALHGLGWA